MQPFCRAMRVIFGQKDRSQVASYFCYAVELKKLKTYFVVVVVFALLAAFDLGAQQLNPPELTCLQVADNGDLTINWNAVADPGGNFTQYDIYSSTSAGGGYSLVTSESFIGVTNYFQPTIATLSDNYFYYIQTLSTDGTNTFTSIASDTLSTIFLTATPMASGYAFLNWNSPFLSSYNAPPGLEYQVYREYPAGVWSLVQVMPFGVTNSNYEIFDTCLDYMNFRVELSMPNGCVFTSNIAGDVFENFAPPVIPVVNNISIDHTLNRAVIDWEPSPSPDTQGYIIYLCDEGNTYIRDTVFGSSNTIFTDIFSGSLVTTGPVSYTVAAFDNCYHGTPPSPNTSALGPCHTSVYLPAISFAYCNDFVDFHWSTYDGWEDGVESYIVYHAVTPDAAAPYSSLSFSPIDTVAGTQLSYVHTFGDYNQYHCYYIVAKGNITGNLAISNYTRVLTPYPEDPSYLYLGSSSVLSEDSTMIVIDIEPTMDVFRMTLERYDELGFNWDEVIVMETSGQAVFELPDSQLSTEVFSYTYRVITTNICGDIVDTTNVGKTMLLEGQSSQERLVNLIVWSAYEGWEQGVLTYKVHRKIGDGPDEVIAELNADAELFFEDDVSELIYSDGTFCYRIEAIESPSQFGVHSSFSNEICLALKPVIWIPNAFVVGGYNNTFVPVISFANFDSYRMIIYSRWGDIIYETEDIALPWDGKMNGKVVQEGAYTYFLTVKDGEGRAYDYTGYVTVLVEND